MTPRDYDAFCEVVLGFAELKGRQLSAPAIELYWRSMQQWSLTEFRQAAEHLLRTCTFMPTPKDFEDLRRAGELTPGEAWQLVLNGAALEPGSRVARAAEIVGGQYRVRHSDIERDLPHAERRFLEAYEQLSDVDPVREALPQIAKPEARHALRAPVSIGKVAAQVAQLMAPPPKESASVAATPTTPAAPALPREPPINARKKVEALARLGTFADDDIARIASVSIEFVREVRSALESAA